MNVTLIEQTTLIGIRLKTQALHHFDQIYSAVFTLAENAQSTHSSTVCNFVLVLLRLFQVILK